MGETCVGAAMEAGGQGDDAVALPGACHGSGSCWCLLPVAGVD